MACLFGCKELMSIASVSAVTKSMDGHGKAGGWNSWVC